MIHSPFFSKKDYKIIAHNICCIIDNLPLTGTPEQQKKAWEIYVERYGDIKERFV